MGYCNCLVIGHNCVYLNLQRFSPFTEVLRKLFLWAIASKQTENRINHPKKSIIGATIISDWFFTSDCGLWCFSVWIPKTVTIPQKLSLDTNTKKQSCGSPVRSRQTEGRKVQITKRRRKSMKKIRKHFHYSFTFLIDISSNCLGRAFCSSHLRNS